MKKKLVGKKGANETASSVSQLKQKSFEMKMALLQGNSKIDISLFKKIRRQIARIKTAERMQELAAGQK